MRFSYLLLAASLSAASAASNAPFAATARVALSVPRGGASRMTKPNRSTSSAVTTAARGGGQETAVGGGTASIPNEVFNLVKGIVGVGVLSLPAGIAAFGDAPSAAIPAVGLVAAIGTISAYGFSLIGRVCSYTGARSYREVCDTQSHSIHVHASFSPPCLQLTAHSFSQSICILNTERPGTRPLALKRVGFPLCLALSRRDVPS